jgi:hypothetical protein
MNIPYNPMQVQNALQNPVRFPDPRLQQYAAGQPPNPQVPPGPLGLAGLELTSRGAQRQAAANDVQMQSDPSKSPTVFQRKDAELAQARQTMQQMGGLMAELLRKQAQDRQLRDGQGIATLSLPEDMFTAMHGGIVFDGGGAVQKFQDGGSPEEITRQIGHPDFSLITSRRDDILNRVTTLPKNQQNALRFITNQIATNPIAAARAALGVPPSATRPATRPAASSSAPAATESSLEARMKELDRFKPEIDTTILEKYYQDYVGLTEKVAAMIEAGLLSEAKGKEIIEAKKAEMAAQYAEYTQGRDARIEEARAAIEGQAPTFQSRLGRGLTSLVGGDMRNLRVYEALARLGAGASDADRDYTDRRRKAAEYLAEAKERTALADLAEKRGQTTAGETARDKAQERLTKEMQTKVGMLRAQQEGLQALIELENKKQIMQQGIDRARYGAAANLLQEDTRQREYNKRAQATIAAAAARADAKANKPLSITDTLRILEFVRGLPFNDPLLRKFYTDDLRKAVQGAKKLDDLGPAAKQAYVEAEQNYIKTLEGGGATPSSRIK